MNTVGVKNNFAADTSHAPSPAIWEDVRILELLEKPGKGVHFFDDFEDLPLPPTLTTQIGFGRYKGFNTGAGIISRVSTINSVEIMGGAVKMNLDTDNDSSALAVAYPSFFLSNDKATSGALFFECCYAQNSIVTNLASTFIGLAETDQMTLATAVPLNAGDPITNTWSGLGFRIAEDGLGVVDTVYTDRATAFTNIGAAEGGTLAAYTFSKFGMIYDPGAEASKRIRFFLNNQETTTKLTAAQLAATTNLKANCLAPVWASVADSAGTAFEGYMRWWRCAQYFYDM